MEKQTNNNHNGIISLWKFVFCIMIVIFHVTERIPEQGNWMKNGAIGVEFFFLVSGYLMAKKALNVKENNVHLGQENIQYIWKKVKSFFPYILIAFICSFIVKSWYNEYSKSQIINSIWNLFLLDMSGIKSTPIVGQTWYISSMLISMLILYPLVRKYKKNFIYIMAPVIVILVSGYLSHKTGNLRGPTTWMGITYKGTLRAFFELSLGTILYEISEKIKRINFTNIGKLIITLIEVVGFVSILFIVNIQNASNKYDFCMLLILSISITLAFSGNTLFYNFTNKKFIYYLEKLSLPIYLNHIWIIDLTTRLLKEVNYDLKVVLVILVSILFSIICLFCVEKIRNICGMKIKQIFIKENN